MISLVVVAFHKIFNGFSQLRWGVVALQFDDVFEGSVITFNLALDQGVIGGTSNMQMCETLTFLSLYRQFFTITTIWNIIQFHGWNVKPGYQKP